MRINKNKETIIKTIDNYNLLIDVLFDYISKTNRIDDIISVEIKGDYLLVGYTNTSMGYLYNENIGIPINDIINKV